MGGVGGMGATGGSAGTGGVGGTGASGGSAGTGGVGGTGGTGGTPSCTPRVVPPLATKAIAEAAGRPSWHLPLYVTQTPSAPELYVVEQSGRIWVAQNDAALSDPFLDLRDVVSSAQEEGLLGLAFHPDYNKAGDPDNGRFFVYYTEPGGSRIRDVLAEYHRSAGDPLVADPTLVQRLIDLDDNRSNHNGGMMTFGPDGFLYLGIGDGGSGQADNGQNLDTLFGTILRLDVDASNDGFAAPGNPFSASTQPPGDPRIWHYGLRNPWRFSFDRVMGDMYIGDVGAKAWEEIDFAAVATGGINYGWSAYEGNEPRDDQPLPTPATFPIRVISHSSDPILGDGIAAVTGGYVYRGNGIPGLDGFYFYADFGNGRVAAFEYENGTLCNDQEVGELAGAFVSSFGEDNDGELYITYLGGEVYRIVAAP